MTDRDRAGVSRMVVTPEQEGLRLDQAVAALTSLSRRAARELIAAGDVWRNGEALRVQSRTVRAGDVIDVLRPVAEVAPTTPDHSPVKILFKDSWLLVADKPAGVLSQPASSRRHDDLALDQRLLLQLAAREGRQPFLRLVHRLDRLTSGTLLFALAPQALPPLREAWDRGEVRRTYLAVVEGRPSWRAREIEQPLGRDPSHRWRFKPDPHGRPARTSARVAASLPSGDSLVVCRLHTGRTHQVRVHLAAVGHPVIGDRLYGGPPRRDLARPLLHAAVLELPHPRDGERVCAVAPLPVEMTSLLPDGIDATRL